MHVMSLSAKSLGDWFSVSRKGETGVGGLVYAPKGMAVSGFGCKRCLAILSTHSFKIVYKYQLFLYGFTAIIYKCLTII